MSSVPLYEKQKLMRDFSTDHKRVLNFSDAGTGKTAATLHAIANLKAKALVMAPKAIIEPSWVDDCRTFTPALTIMPAYAANRSLAFEVGPDIVVTNHDAAVWLRDNPKYLDQFDLLVMDESTAYKNPTSNRSKAMAYVKDKFERRIALTGTPMSNGLKHIWHQAYLIDDGERLGDSYYRFLNSTHSKKRVTRTVDTWIEKDGMREAVATLLSDITVRFTLDECQDIPPQTIRTKQIELPASVRKVYKQMAGRYYAELNDTTIIAANAAVMTNKLLQIASGGLYDNMGDAEWIASEASERTRNDLIAELCAERACSLVVFNWAHQKEALIRAFNRVGITAIGIIDGKNSRHTPQTVRDTQAGKLQVVLVHPQSGSHGLTLTQAKTTIWASPIYNAEFFQQLNRRTRRTGQTEETEVICIQAKDTIEAGIYELIKERVDHETTLLELLRSML